MYLPTVVNPEGVIFDGHNRYEICVELGLEPKCEVSTFEDPLLEKFVIESNLIRRHLTTFQRVEMGLPLILINKEIMRSKKENRALVGEKSEAVGWNLFDDSSQIFFSRIDR